MNEILVVGLSHKTSPLELRERCARGDRAAALAELKTRCGQACVIETCNRYEVYTEGAEHADPLVAWLAERAGVPVADMEAATYRRTGRNACKHLFFVASSLDSLVVGETQIRGQVKQAYQEAHDAGAAGSRLHRLFQTALRVSKTIADRTGVGRGNVSIAGAAAALAESVFGRLSDARVLVLGAGDTAELLLAHLQGRGVGGITVANRTPARAEALAAKYGGAGAGFDALDRALAEADVLLCAAGGDAPLVDAAKLRSALRERRGRPIVAIDVAVPRGIDPAVDALDNVYRYDLDALERVTEDALRRRRRDFIQCCTLVDSAALRLDTMLRAQAAGSAIADLEDAFQEVADRELSALERRLPGLGDDEKEQVRRSIRRLVKKLLHRPVRAMRSADEEESEVIRRAFVLPPDDDDAQ